MSWITNGCRTAGQGQMCNAAEAAESRDCRKRTENCIKCLAATLEVLNPGAKLSWVRLDIESE